MPQLIIHSENDGRARVKAELVKSLRACMVETLALREDQGQVLLYETLPIYRAMSEDRKGLIFIEIKMIEGRSDVMKKALTDGIIEIVSKDMGIEKKCVMCLFDEYAANAYVAGK